MPSISDFAAKGKILRVEGDHVVFAPANSSYEMHLKGGYIGKFNMPVSILIRASARKVFTLPTGGNFVTPIFGPPKVLQGWVRMVDGGSNTIVVHGGVPVVVALPGGDDAIDLNNGEIGVNAMVNATLMGGASFEVV